MAEIINVERNPLPPVESVTIKLSRLEVMNIIYCCKAHGLSLSTHDVVRLLETAIA